MDSKKNEDYAIKIPEEHEMRNFSSSPSQREPFISRTNSGKPGGIGGIVPVSNITNSPPISILAYCLASISMTVTNKYCVSGANWNLNFFYLAIQVRYTSTKDELDGGILMR
jgi:GDP-mannose transporter